MLEFAADTLTGDSRLAARGKESGRKDSGAAVGSENRYLWTDAFALLNFLELGRITGKHNYLDLARRLIDAVHYTLGRHRGDDARSGWISGLKEDEGKKHPAAGGLRIGKKLNERRPEENGCTGRCIGR